MSHDDYEKYESDSDRKVETLRAAVTRLRAEVERLTGELSWSRSLTAETRTRAERAEKERDGAERRAADWYDRAHDAEARERIVVQGFQVREARIRDLEAGLGEVLRYAERQTCMHEETHRAGFIWEVCNLCGRRWADDRGGKPEWVEPPELDRAHTLLAPAGESWSERHEREKRARAEANRPSCPSLLHNDALCVCLAPAGGGEGLAKIELHESCFPTPAAPEGGEHSCTDYGDRTCARCLAESPAPTAPEGCACTHGGQCMAHAMYGAAATPTQKGGGDA